MKKTKKCSANHISAKKNQLIGAFLVDSAIFFNESFMIGVLDAIFSD